MLEIDTAHKRQEQAENVAFLFHKQKGREDAQKSFILLLCEVRRREREKISFFGWQAEQVHFMSENEAPSPEDGTQQ